MFIVFFTLSTYEVQTYPLYERGISRVHSSEADTSDRANDGTRLSSHKVSTHISTEDSIRAS